MENIKISLNTEIQNLKNNQEQQKENIINETNSLVEQYISGYEKKKAETDEEFRLQVERKKAEFENIIQKQKDEYNNRIEQLKETNETIYSNLTDMTNKYQHALQEESVKLQNFLTLQEQKYELLKKEYQEKSKVAQENFNNVLKELEDKKMERIKSYALETQQEIQNIKNTLEIQKQNNELEAITMQKKLSEMMERLETEKINLVKRKQIETEESLNKLKQNYDDAVRTIDRNMDQKLYEIKILDEQIESKKLDNQTQFQSNILLGIIIVVLLIIILSCAMSLIIKFIY